MLANLFRSASGHVDRRSPMAAPLGAGGVSPLFGKAQALQESRQEQHQLEANSLGVRSAGATSTASGATSILAEASPARDEDSGYPVRQKCASESYPGGDRDLIMRQKLLSDSLRDEDSADFSRQKFLSDSAGWGDCAHPALHPVRQKCFKERFHDDAQKLSRELDERLKFNPQVIKWRPGSRRVPLELTPGGVQPSSSQGSPDDVAAHRRGRGMSLDDTQFLTESPWFEPDAEPTNDASETTISEEPEPPVDVDLGTDTPEEAGILMQRQSSEVTLDGDGQGQRRRAKTEVGRYGRFRSQYKDPPDLLGKGMSSAALEIDSSSSRIPQTVEERFDMVAAFVARRVYRRIREGSLRTTTPALLELFDETRFKITGLEGGGDRCSCVNPLSFFRRSICSNPPPSVPEDVPVVPEECVTSTDVFVFVRQFAAWCAMPMDLLVVALVYIDRILDDGSRGAMSAEGVLTEESWRPVIIVCLVLASKAWEDYCICNCEAAQYAGYTRKNMLLLELLALDTLSWSVHISSDVFAPYFGAIKRVLETGIDDDAVGKLSYDRVPTNSCDRSKLEKLRTTTM